MERRVAIVTGAARGIGLAIAKALLNDGLKVVLVDVVEKVGEATCLTLRGEYGKERTTFVKCDVTSEDEMRAVFDKAMELYGRLDVVVNNAGIVDEINWRKMIDINLNAVMQGTYLGIEYMSTQNEGKGGNVINIASYAGLLPEPTAPGYSASKAGVVGFTRALRPIAKSDGVRVNCICPTFIDTDMGKIAMGHEDARVKATIQRATLLSPNLVAEAVLVLMKDRSKAGDVARVTPRNGIDFHIVDKRALLSLMQKL